MELNMVLFQAPKASYTESSFKQELVYIPANPDSPDTWIPCLFLKCARASSKLILYFHGNAEDVGHSYELLDHLRFTLMAHVIAVEYPGYGVYKGSASESKVLEDARLVFDFFTYNMAWPSSNIIVIGRSLGSAPATWLAANRDICALVLISAFTSIRAVARHFGGRLLQYLVKDQFKNIELIPRVFCPTFLLHGQNDRLIPFKQARKLQKVCSGPCSLLLPRDMDHNEFDYFDDLTMPLTCFLDKCGVSVYSKNGPDLNLCKYLSC